MESSHIPTQILTYRPRKRRLGYSLRRENNTLLKKWMEHVTHRLSTLTLGLVYSGHSWRI
jgi:hypothetical protein